MTGPQKPQWKPPNIHADRIDALLRIRQYLRPDELQFLHDVAKDSMRATGFQKFKIQHLWETLIRDFPQARDDSGVVLDADEGAPPQDGPTVATGQLEVHGPDHRADEGASGAVGGDEAGGMLEADRQ